MTLLHYPAGDWYKSWEFPCGELGVELDTFLVTGCKEIQAFLYTPKDILEFSLLVDALKREGVELKTLKLPYVPYSRQDRVTSRGTSFSLKVFADLVNSWGFSEVISYSQHSNVCEFLIDNFKNVEPYPQLAMAFHKLKEKDLLLVSPDLGAVKRTEGIAKYLRQDTIGIAHKNRNPTTGEIIGMQLVTEIPEDKHLIVFDDICDGGRTFIELAKVLPKERKSLSLFVTHGFFTKGVDILYDAGYDHVKAAFWHDTKGEKGEHDDN